MRRLLAGRWLPLCVLAACAGLAGGCGTTRWTDTDRTATEQLLVSDAIDQAVSRIDFSLLQGHSVYLDTGYLAGTVDQAYLVSSVRQRLLASGCYLTPSFEAADYIVELRAGGIGTDRNDRLLVGVPQMALPMTVFGATTTIPEIALVKTSRQVGVAKIGVFAYEQCTGRPIWASGLVQDHSALQRNWFLGTGPYERGPVAVPGPPQGGLGSLKPGKQPESLEDLPRHYYSPLWQEAVFDLPENAAPLPAPLDASAANPSSAAPSMVDPPPAPLPPRTPRTPAMPRLPEPVN